MTIDDLATISGITVDGYALPAGEIYMDPMSGRCGRCDARYCVNGCFAGEKGYVYCTGFGWVTYQQARDQEHLWASQGLDFGPNHPLRRVEWGQA